MSSYEREILVEALKSTRGNMAKAARALGTTAAHLLLSHAQARYRPRRLPELSRQNCPP